MRGHEKVDNACGEAVFRRTIHSTSEYSLTLFSRGLPRLSAATSKFITTANQSVIQQMSRRLRRP